MVVGFLALMCWASGARAKDTGLHGMSTESPVLPAVHTVMLVRVGPTIKSGQRQRLLAWYWDVAQYEPALALFISADVTNGSTAFRDLRSVLPRNRVHAVAAPAVTRDYPLSWREDSPWVLKHGPLGRGFHVDFVSYWARHVMKWQFRFLWVVEEDIGITGSVGALLLSYMRCTADLLTMYPARRLAPPPRALHKEDWRFTPKKKTWSRTHLVTPAYARTFAEHRRFMAWDFFIRMSRGLVEEAHELSKRRGISAWSEQVYSTVAVSHPARKFTRCVMDDEHVGVAKPYERINQTTWARYQRSQRQHGNSAGPGRVYHALKW